MNYGKILLKEDIWFAGAGHLHKGNTYDVVSLCNLNRVRSGSEDAETKTAHEDVGYGIIIDGHLEFVPGTSCIFVDWK